MSLMNLFTTEEWEMGWEEKQSVQIFVYFADTNYKGPRNTQLDQNAVKIHQSDLD